MIRNAGSDPLPLAGRTVCIDPGHGGPDTGAIGPTGVREKDVNLAVALGVRDRLTAQGARVVMTRDTDRSVASPDADQATELQARCDIATRARADIFVSVHSNAAEKPSANGMETYHARQASDASVLLARSVFASMDEKIELRPRGVFPANFYVIHKATMPAELTEMAFVTNPVEEQLLASSDFQARMAEAITGGVVAYFTVSDQTRPSTERPPQAPDAPIEPLPEETLGLIAR